MTTKKIKIYIVCIIVLFALGYFATPYVSNYLRWGRAMAGVNTFPTQIAITGVTVTPCIVSCYPAENCCMGGTLCISDIPPLCTKSTVNGAPAGGNGIMALIQKTTLAATGVVQGGQMIAGCLSPTMCDGGVVAGNAGCFGPGCVVIETGPIQKFKNWFTNIVSNFIIAGNKDN